MRYPTLDEIEAKTTAAFDKEPPQSGAYFPMLSGTVKAHYSSVLTDLSRYERTVREVADRISSGMATESDAQRLLEFFHTREVA